MNALRDQKIAVLYQALPPPVIDGVRKDAKPGGYSDSGADIAFCLARARYDVATRVAKADPGRDLDWVYPDTAAGIAEARAAGASVLWANTVLFDGHPLQSVARDMWIVGQSPSANQRFDDKFHTNAFLRNHGLPVANALLVGAEEGAGLHALGALNGPALQAHGLVFPLVVKPVRGRGSQGVSLVEDFPALVQAVTELLRSGRFGGEIILEQYLAGTELTVTVMPRDAAGRPWGLPPVRRFNHVQGIAPYNGVVAVTQNSAALGDGESQDPAIGRMLDACVRAAELVQARAPIRIDCRADGEGRFLLFDLNMKPNMTGSGRPGREDQDSLSLIAARAIGWSYLDLLSHMLADAWREPAGEALRHLVPPTLVRPTSGALAARRP
jgi:D-alanine-D-alanine ligase